MLWENSEEFFKHSCEGKIAILIVYVDDIILSGDDNLEIERLKGLLAWDFGIKDLGTLKYFLGGICEIKERDFCFLCIGFTQGDRLVGPRLLLTIT